MSPRAAWRLEALGFGAVYDYVAGKADWAAAGLPRDGSIAQKTTVGDVADSSVPTCRLDERLEEVQGRVAATGWEMCVVVNDERIVLGRLGRKALGSNIDATVEDVMANGPSTVRPNALLEETAARLLAQDLTTALVTTSDGRLVGVARLDQ